MSGIRPSVHVRGQRGSGMGGHQRGYRGNSIEWYTPPGIIDALGLEYDLDPCSPAGGLAWIPAKQVYSIERDGLSQPWHGRVWLNPPYGPRTGDWMRRLAAHGNGIALVFARTETEWWQQTVGSAHGVCFIAGRLTFVDEDHQPGSFNAGAPSALIGFGQECAEAIARARLGMTLAVRSTALAGQASLYEGIDHLSARLEARSIANQFGALRADQEEARALLRAARGEAMTHELHERIVAYLERREAAERSQQAQDETA